METDNSHTLFPVEKNDWELIKPIGKIAQS